MSQSGSFNSGGGGGGAGGVLLQTINASNSSSIDFTGLTGYDQYEVQFYSVLTTGTSMQFIRFSTDNGSTWEATNYNYASSVAFPNSGGLNGATGQTAIDISTATTDSATLPWSGFFRFQNFATALAKSAYGRSVGQFSGCLQYEGSGYWVGVPVVNGIQFIPDAGTFISGTFKIYGI